MSRSQQMLALANPDAPKALEYLTSELIHPDNVALKARLAAAPMPGALARLRLRVSVWRGRRRLAGTGYFARRTEMKAVRSEIQELHLQYKEVESQRLYLIAEDDMPAADKAEAALTRINRRAVGLMVQYRQMEADIEPLLAVDTRARRAHLALEVYASQKHLAKLRHKEQKAMAKEAEFLVSAIQNTWKNTRGCHHVWHDHRGKRRVTVPYIDRVDVMEDSVWFKIRGATKSLFGFKYGLPYGVNASALTGEDAMNNLQVAIRREVYGKVDPARGAWVVVRRLDTPGGIVRRVLWRDVLSHYPSDEQHKMPVPLGVAEGNNIKWLNLADWEHYLIGGSTGGGKSNFVNALLCSLLRYQSPEHLRIAFVDLKRNEFNFYEDVPHKLGDIIHDVNDVHVLLNQLLAMMKERYKLQRARRVKDLASYNEKVSPEKRLPRILCVIDEAYELTGYGDLTKELHHMLTRLTSLGRAAGIHIMLCTQRPLVSVIPGNIKVNCGVRVAFRMPDTVSSQTILSNGAAKNLPRDIRGRAMVQITPEPEMMQTPLIEDRDVTESVKAAQSFGPAPDLHLPDAGQYKPAVLDVEGLVKFVAEFLGGRWSADRVWSHVKKDKEISMTRRAVQQLVKDAEDALAEPMQLGDRLYTLEQGTGRQRFLKWERVENEAG